MITPNYLITPPKPMAVDRPAINGEKNNRKRNIKFALMQPDPLTQMSAFYPQHLTPGLSSSLCGYPIGRYMMVAWSLLSLNSTRGRRRIEFLTVENHYPSMDDSCAIHFFARSL
ncbi:hypothetical protein O181_001005 [Austropuccinia psidii MF-1]|uniref:Uncharacterized protein n=1 Tax=Austropuccinia psidii MF-1 TaxID=1389203 RepID=A0A9Q3GBE5_9BASI|nr:hypothetical protein [Austropuccinia psidii MF-1]